MNKRIEHPFGPLFDKNSRVLILGSFPSVKSRQQNFFYGHPQNRFWRVIASITDMPVPEDITQKKELILENHLALWDTIASCEITGSSDSSIKNAVPNDLSLIIDKSSIKRIFCNGKKSFELYDRYISPVIKMPAECLPSTSPANAAWTFDRLVEAWKVIRSALLL